MVHQYTTFLTYLHRGEDDLEEEALLVPAHHQVPLPHQLLHLRCRVSMSIYMHVMEGVMMSI